MDHGRRFRRGGLKRNALVARPHRSLLARTQPRGFAGHRRPLDHRLQDRRQKSADRPTTGCGRTQARPEEKTLDGSALQLGLYALAAGALGAQRIEVSLLSPLVRPLQPQISGSDFSSETEIFAAVAEMQQTGVFGMHGQLRGAFRFTDDYPLATLGIDSDILEQRWELTHPALVRDEEDIFW